MMLIPFILIRTIVVLKVTVIRDSLIRFRYTTKDILVMISLMIDKIMHG
jgi:hypothetical protein